MRHSNALHESVKAFVGEQREPVRGIFDTDDRQYLFSIPLERHPPDWSVLLGDYAFNARASLDYLISALARSSGKAENTSSEFPIYGINRRIHWTNIDQWWEDDPTDK